MKKLGFFVGFLALLLSGCAQEPSPIVAKPSEVGGISTQNPSVSQKIMAVTYKGFNLNDFQDCELKIAVREQGGKKEFFTKVDYILHNQKLPDLKTEGYRFRLRSNTYSDVNSAAGNLVLAAAIQRDGNEANINQLRVLEDQSKLEYSLRVDLSTGDFEGFSDAIAAVTNNPNDLAAYESTLKQVNRVVFKKYHRGHYDASLCEGFDTVEVEEVEFTVGAPIQSDDVDADGDDDHDGDDHDHDEDDHGEDDHDDHGDHDEHDHDEDDHDHL